MRNGALDVLEQLNIKNEIRRLYRGAVFQNESALGDEGIDAVKS